MEMLNKLDFKYKQQYLQYEKYIIYPFNNHRTTCHKPEQRTSSQLHKSKQIKPKFSFL